MQVEGDDDGSENEEGGPSEAAADSSGPSSILSPTSKRARKRAVAARNKRLAKEAKEAASAAAAAAATSGTTTMNGSSSAKHQKTVPPTFVSQPGPAKPVAAQSREKVQAGGTKAPGGLIPPTFVGSSAASQPAADKPFLASSAAQAADPASSPAVDSQASSKAVEKEASQVQFSDEEESEEEDPDASVLVDEDEELTASSAASQDEGEEEEESEDGDDSAMTPKQERSAAFEAAAATSGEDAPLTAKVAGDGKDSSSLSTQQTGPAQGENALQYGTDHDPSKKRASVVTRTVWTLIMIGGFIGAWQVPSMVVGGGCVQSIESSRRSAETRFSSFSSPRTRLNGPRVPHHPRPGVPGSGLQGDLCPFRRSSKAAPPRQPSPPQVGNQGCQGCKGASRKGEVEQGVELVSIAIPCGQRSLAHAQATLKRSSPFPRYFFAVTNYFLHGETIIYYFKVRWERGCVSRPRQNPTVQS